MESDTDCLPQLDPADFVETIVLEDSDIMATREMRLLLDPNAGAPEDGAPAENDED
ncbi:MAG TPA: hypothetical protein VF200_04945 [Woeseiaceae bacterium]